MLKRILTCCSLLLVASFLVAGDAAAYVDEGFSENGNIYVFGQYGSVDKTWQGYAEIYTVDIAENDYVDGGVFTTPAGSNTAGKNGHTLYTALRNKNTAYLDSLGLRTVDITNVLYLKNDSRTSSDSISITDFEDSKQTYSVSLTPWYSGNTPSSKSSFFITVEKFDDAGNLVGKQVIGNPDIKRRGVVGYSIEKIMRSPNNESFIFIVEKTIATANGNSIRYMVETLEIDNFEK